MRFRSDLGVSFSSGSHFKCLLYKRDHFWVWGPAMDDPIFSAPALSYVQWLTNESSGGSAAKCSKFIYKMVQAPLHIPTQILQESCISPGQDRLQEISV